MRSGVTSNVEHNDQKIGKHRHLKKQKQETFELLQMGLFQNRI